MKLCNFQHKTRNKDIHAVVPKFDTKAIDCQTFLGKKLQYSMVQHSTYEASPTLLQHFLGPFYKEFTWTITGLFSAKKHVYGQLQGAAMHPHHEVLDKHTMGSKNFVLLLEWQCSMECCCCSSESSKSMWILRNLYYKTFCWLCHQTCLNTGREDTVAGTSAATLFSIKNNVPGVSSIV